MEYPILVNVKIKSVIQTHYELKQQDYGQKIIVTAEDYDINGTTARLFINKNDGTVDERIMTKENDSYTYILDSDDTSCPGKTVFDVKYYKQGVRDSSASFIFNIIPDRLGKLNESENFSDSIIQAIERCDNAIARIQTQANQAIQDVENALLTELNIYNGYDKTTAGYAADVRQLNESIVGTYAEMIKERIGNLSSLSTAAKSSLVGAINELKDKNDTVNNNLTGNKVLLTPLNGWNASSTAVYAQRIGERVFLGGLLNVGTITKGTTLAILPEGYRPVYLEVVSACITSGTVGSLQFNILGDGTIWIESVPSGATTISLNNVSFSIN